MTSPSREIEFKFGVSGRQAFYRLVTHLELPESVLKEGMTQVNHFFDSKALCLHQKHFVIRVREENRSYILTIKGERSSAQNGNSVLSNRVEEEVMLPQLAAENLLQGMITPQQAISDHFKSRSAPILQMLSTACNNQDLVHIGEFSNVRIHLPPVMLSVANSREMLEFELDSSTFPDGSVDHEIEIEIHEQTDAAGTEAVLIDLLKQAGIEWHAAPSKAERFFASLRQG